MTRINLIRHGETEWNVEGRYQGQADPPLNANGLEQAHQLAGLLQDLGIDVLYTSPLKRALQTAQVLADRLGVLMKLDDRLMEIHQGDWQTRLRSEIEMLYPSHFKRWETEPWEVTPPGGEQLVEVQERVEAAMDEILILHPNQYVGIITHRIPIAMIKLRYQRLNADIVRTLELPNTYYEEIVIGEITE